MRYHFDVVQSNSLTTMDAPELSQSPEPYQPTSDQVRRLNQTRRFNRLFVYFPIGLVSALVVVLIAGMIILVLTTPEAELVGTFSAIADSVLILSILLLMLIIGLFILIFGAVFSQGRKAGLAPIRQTRRVFWRLENMLVRIQGQVNSSTPRIAAPFISIQAWVAFWRVLIHKLTRFFSRR